MTISADLLPVLKHLYSFGYFNDLPEVFGQDKKPSWDRVRTASRDTITAALDAFHRFNGLPPMARQAGTAVVAADIAVKTMLAPRCGIPEFSGMAEARWQKPEIRYWDNITMPGFTDGQVKEIVDQAWKNWAEVCGIRPVRVLDMRQANVASTSRRINGRGGVLAYAYFPTTGAPNEQREQVYDTGDAEYFRQGRNLENCCTHEIGHSLGFAHGPGGRCNMSPFLVAQFWKPQTTYDIPTARKSYGAALPDDGPDDPPPPPPIDPRKASFVGSGIF